MWEPPSTPSPSAPLPFLSGPSATLEPLFCCQHLSHIQCGMLETENLVPGASPCPPPTVWGQWPNTARCPPGAKWKASSSPPTFTCPEHRNSGRTWALSHCPLSPTPTALALHSGVMDCLCPQPGFPCIIWLEVRWKVWRTLTLCLLRFLVLQIKYSLRIQFLSVLIDIPSDWLALARVPVMMG